MQQQPDVLEQLHARLARITDLQRASAVLSWDQETFMPSGGVGARAEQLSTLSGLTHALYTDRSLGDLLDQADDLVAGENLATDAHSLVRFHRREHHKQARLPNDLVMEIARVSVLSLDAWRQAREQSSFAHFLPFLRQMLDLKREYAQALGSPTNNLYDALIDDYDPGLTHTYISGLFEAVKPRLISLTEAIAARQGAVDDGVLHLNYPAADQLAFSQQVAAQLGYDFDRGRLDLSTHPFSTSFGRGDARITTRVQADFLPTCLMGVIHETGHALYEQNVSPALDRTGLDTGTSMSIHESQSRFYENILGRSRAFWVWAYPRLQAVFPQQLGGVGAEAFYRALNKVEPSLIRVEADEVTYGLHIILRFELENALFNDKLAPDDLPAAWNDKMQAYLGLRPSTDAQGALQDIHWSMGAFGYFPDYLLGSMFSVQLWQQMQRDLPDAPALVEAGSFGPITAWLGQHIHQHGSKFTFPEVAERVTGGPLRWEPYISYLETKFGSIYGL